MKKIASFSTESLTGRKWEQEGDYGFVAVGTETPDKPDKVEIDITATSPEQIKRLIVTVMVIVNKSFPGLPEEIIELYKERKYG